MEAQCPINKLIAGVLSYYGQGEWDNLAGLAQLAEYLFRKKRVTSSTLVSGSKKVRLDKRTFLI